MIGGKRLLLIRVDDGAERGRPRRGNRTRLPESPLTPAAGDNSILVFGGNLTTGTSAQSTGDLNIYQLQIGTYAIAGGTTRKPAAANCFSSRLENFDLTLS